LVHASGSQTFNVGAVANQQDVRGLSFDQRIRNEIKGEDVHVFAITLGLNQYVQLIVERQGIDLVVGVLAPDRSVAAKFENPAGPLSQIVGLFKAEAPGTYTLEIRPARKWLPKGSYEILLHEVAIPSLTDEKRLLAQLKLFEGRRQQAFDTSDSLHLAIASYEQSLTLWRESADTFEEANTLQLTARVYKSLGNLKQAETYLNRALELRPRDSSASAYTLLDLADAYYSLKSPRASLAKYEEVLKSFKQAEDRRGTAAVLAQIGLVHMRLFDWSGARDILESARELDHTEGDVYEETRVFNSLGGVFDNLGQPEKALEMYQLAGGGFARLGAKAREGNVHINIGVHYDTWGEWRDAIAYYNSALKLIADGHASGEVDRAFANAKKASLFYNLGSLYIGLGAFPEGLDYLQKSLELRTSNERGATLTLLAYSHILSSEPDQALTRCREALSVQEPAGDPRRAQTYTVMGLAEQALGHHEKAIELFDRAFEIQNSKDTQDLKGLAITMDKRSASFAARGDPTRARKDLAGAISLWRRFKDRNGEALSLFQLARLDRDTGNVDAGLASAAAAIKLVEPLRKNVVGQQLRASYFATKVDYYELYIDLIMSSGSNLAERALAGFEASERERARGLLDAQSVANYESVAPLEANLAALIEKHKNLQRTILVKTSQRSQYLLRTSVGKEISELDRELISLTTARELVEQQIKLQYPHYAGLSFADPLPAPKIQRELDADTLLIEYALGDRRSYVWAVTPNSIDAFELPAGEKINLLARRFTNALTALNTGPQNETLAQRQARIGKANSEYTKAASELSEVILGKLAPSLGNKRLVVVADGALQTVPFAALPIPPISANVETTMSATANSSGTESSKLLANSPRIIASDPKPLLVEHEIITLPSASVLALQRRELANRRPSSLEVVVLADPVFDAEDSRVEQARRNTQKVLLKTARNQKTPPNETQPNQQGPPTPNTALSSALRDVGLEGKLPRLLSSRKEARAIMQVAPAGQSMSAFDFHATREMALKPELSKYRIVHFATHGVLDLEHPELSGIVFSMVNEKGQPRDGYLRLEDIYNMNLSADLVVLSACQTGIGKQIKGEGLIALTRGFMYAGAKSIVASLWKVDDAATSALMAEFYRQMFINKLKPSAALRAAQLKLAQQSRWQSPYYWAGFFIQGDWN